MNRFRAAISVSPFSESVIQQVRLTDGVVTAGSVRELQLLYVRHGSTEVYQRIATRRRAPQGLAEHGWERGLERARLARDLGLAFNPEIGLFASYGDAGSYQESPDFTDYPSISLPRPWTSLTLEQMLPPLRAYGALVARQILGTGARVSIWDIGNEVEAGVAGVTVRPSWLSLAYRPPDAVDPAIGWMTLPRLFLMPETERIAWCRAHLWPSTARILSAVAQGIRSVDPSARFSTHISGAFQRTSAVPVAFWETMREHGYLPDQFGQTFWGTAGTKQFGPADTFARLREVATELDRRLGRPMFIAEYGFPSARLPRPFDWNDPQPGYAETEQGQYAFTRDVVAWGLCTGRLSGIRPWAPDLCTNPGWSPLGWFNASGKAAGAKPVLHAIKDAMAEADNGGCRALSSARTF